MAGYTLRLTLGIMVAGDNLAHDHQQEYCPYYLFGFFTQNIEEEKNTYI